MELGKLVPEKWKGIAERQWQEERLDRGHRLNDVPPSGKGGNHHARIHRCVNETRIQSGRLKEPGREKSIAVASAYLPNFYNGRPWRKKSLPPDIRRVYSLSLLALSGKNFSPRLFLFLYPQNVKKLFIAEIFLSKYSLHPSKIQEWPHLSLDYL